MPSEHMWEHFSSVMIHNYPFASTCTSHLLPNSLVFSMACSHFCYFFCCYWPSDLSAPENYSGNPFLPSDSDLLLESPDHDDIGNFDHLFNVSVLKTLHYGTLDTVCCCASSWVFRWCHRRAISIRRGETIDRDTQIVIWIRLPLSLSFLASCSSVLHGLVCLP